MSDEPRVGHIADRHMDGWALCGAKLPLKRLGAEPPARPAEFCTACEKRWAAR